MTSATYVDYLAQLMLGPHDDLAERFQLWRALIEAERPDLIIADYAPSVSLLFYGRIPVVNIGNGYVLPPATLPAFPRLTESAPVQFEESDSPLPISALLPVLPTASAARNRSEPRLVEGRCACCMMNNMSELLALTGLKLLPRQPLRNLHAVEKGAQPLIIGVHNPG
jgi:hypothetical protein